MLLPAFLAFVAIVVGTSGPKPGENEKVFLAPASEHVVVVDTPAVAPLQIQSVVSIQSGSENVVAVVGSIAEVPKVEVVPLVAGDDSGEPAALAAVEKIEAHLLVAGGTPLLTEEAPRVEEVVANKEVTRGSKKPKKSQVSTKEAEKEIPSSEPSQVVLVGDFPSLADGHARLMKAGNQRLVRISIFSGIGGTGNGKVTCEIDEKGYSNAVCYNAKIVLDQQLSMITLQPPAPILERSIEADWVERIEGLRRDLKERYQNGKQYSRSGLMRTSRISACPNGGESAPNLFQVLSRNCLARVAYAQEYYGNDPVLAARDRSGVRVDTYTQKCIEESSQTPLFCNAGPDDST